MRDEELVASYRKLRIEALETVRLIDEEGFRFFENQSDGTMRDATAERRAGKLALAERLERAAVEMEHLITGNQK